MRVLVLLGPPGAGKGTQAEILSRRLAIPHLASGDLLRAAVAAGTAVGREAERYMSIGQLVPDDVVVRVFLERLGRPDATSGAILDGFPRTGHQARVLDEALVERSAHVEAAVLIDVPADELVRRAAGRRICEANGHVYNLVSNPPLAEGVCDLDGSPLIQRLDDDERTVRARLAQQLPPLQEVVDHYRAAGVLRVVDGLRPISEVTDELLSAVGEALARPPAALAAEDR
ncbi:MAG TPA: nucleoside monophosphate kinase [Candidatus Limnocylindrales bacterium]|nr:nucleoside monophosphate kinase [Candidatus Limnocylindrales bacterium]